MTQTEDALELADTGWEVKPSHHSVMHVEVGTIIQPYYILVNQSLEHLINQEL